MNHKLEYISRLFQKTSSKRIEHYVLTRIWHHLNDDSIKMSPQQYVSRHLDKYAMTDVYFPQICIHIEVNEPAHYDNQFRIEQDLKRKLEIEQNTGHKVFTIDCRENIEGIHLQIENVISEINSRAKQQRKSEVFKSWNPDNEHNPEYWKSKKSISISDEISFYTIEEICQLFNADPNKTKRGFLRKGGIQHPLKPEIFIWWPSEYSRGGWVNHYDEVEGIITETHSDDKKKIDHYNYHSQGLLTRIVFYHYKDILGFRNYKFVGVFTNDKTKSNENIGTVWVRVVSVINLETLTYE
jgi:hypothetical protein